jgi:hypothetical protein
MQFAVKHSRYACILFSIILTPLEPPELLDLPLVLEQNSPFINTDFTDPGSQPAREQAQGFVVLILPAFLLNSCFQFVFIGVIRGYSSF